jgi:hypothetical protein
MVDATAAPPFRRVADGKSALAVHGPANMVPAPISLAELPPGDVRYPGILHRRCTGVPRP